MVVSTIVLDLKVNIYIMNNGWVQVSQLSLETFVHLFSLNSDMSNYLTQLSTADLNSATQVTKEFRVNLLDLNPECVCLNNMLFSTNKMF